EGLHRWKLQHSVYFVGKQSQDVLHGVLRNSKVGQDGYGSLRISVAIFCSGTRLWFLHLNMYPPTCTRCIPQHVPAAKAVRYPTVTSMYSTSDQTRRGQTYRIVVRSLSQRKETMLIRKSAKRKRDAAIHKSPAVRDR